MLKKDKQGTKANKSGKELENNVENYLCENHNFFPIQYSAWENDRTKIPNYTKRLLLKNARYTNIYGSSNCRGEFLLTCDGRKDIRIECRAQYVSGSVDEKLPYFIANAAAFEERHVILVVEGDGYKFGAKEWLKAQVDSIKYKDIQMFSFEEFKNWADNEFSIMLTDEVETV